MYESEIQRHYVEYVLNGGHWILHSSTSMFAKLCLSTAPARSSCVQTWIEFMSYNYLVQDDSRGACSSFHSCKILTWNKIFSLGLRSTVINTICSDKGIRTSRSKINKRFRREWFIKDFYFKCWCKIKINDKNIFDRVHSSTVHHDERYKQRVRSSKEWKRMTEIEVDEE